MINVIKYFFINIKLLILPTNSIVVVLQKYIDIKAVYEVNEKTDSWKVIKV